MPEAVISPTESKPEGPYNSYDGVLVYNLN